MPREAVGLASESSADRWRRKCWMLDAGWRMAGRQTIRWPPPTDPAAFATRAVSWSLTAIPSRPNVSCKVESSNPLPVETFGQQFGGVRDPRRAPPSSIRHLPSSAGDLPRLRPQHSPAGLRLGEEGARKQLAWPRWS